MIFRILYYTLYTIGTVAALLSPLIFIQWLMIATQFEPAIALFSWLNPVSQPLHQTLAGLLPFQPPPVQFGDKAVSIIPAITGALLATSFAVFSWLAQQVNEIQERLETEISSQKASAASKKAEMEFKKQQAQMSNFRQILVYIQFPMREFPHLGKVFQQFQPYGGQEHPGQPSTLLIGFKDLQMALAYAIQASNTLTNYYLRTKPSEIKPPFRCGIQPVWENDSLEDALNICDSLIKYASENKMLFSSSLKQLLEARGLDKDYKYSSMGYYMFPGNSNKEVYTLLPVLPESKHLGDEKF